jgi:hypothetical protein
MEINQGRSMNRTYRRARRATQEGFATIAILSLVLVVTLTLLFMFNTSLTQLRMSRSGQNKATGLALAEAGVDDTVDQLRKDHGFAGPVSGALTTDTGANFGSYNATISTTSDPYVRLVNSTGTNPDGSTQRVAALINLDMRPLGWAAILSNGDVNVNGGALVNSNPADLHISDVIANGNISMGGSSTVDGTLVAGGTTSGQGYFPSQTGQPTYPFPDSAEQTQMKADWVTQAMAGGQISGVNNSATITAPKYINGDINLSSYSTVTLNGSGVIYVNGNVKMTANSVLTNGVTLVVRGTVNQSGQSIYKITPGILPTPTLVAIGTGASVNDTVISLTGGSLANQQGIIYAMNGSIKVAGGSLFVGELVAGQPGAQINVTGGYTQAFPSGMASAVKFPNGASTKSIVEL